MRKSANTPGESKSLRLVVLFLLALFFAVSVSLIVKTVTLIRTSTYDGKHRFTTYLSSKGSKSALLISLEPNSPAVFLTMKGEVSEKSVSSLLSLPIDATIQMGNVSFEDVSPNDLLGKALFSPKTHLAGFTRYDLLKLYLVSAGSSKDGVFEEVSLRKGIPEDYSSKKYFVDHGITDDNKSIGVVNSTGVSGIGQRLEQALTLMGGNVVSVTTGRQEQEPTYIFYSGSKAYTVQKLERLFHQQAEEGNTQAADILVVIGKRSLSLPLFGTL